jgi:glycosyltransferase involved in cell wall biosynthesis
MHIAVDARELAGDRTGVGRYLEQLLAHWNVMANAQRHHFTLISPTPIAHTASALSVTQLVVPGGRGTAWEQFRLPAALRRLGADVLFAPAYSAPIRSGMPIALALHDVSFFAHPEWYGPREGLRRRLVTRAAARVARVILTLSAFQQREIARHLRIPASRIRVIPLGLGMPTVDASEAESGHREAQPLVLYVGSIFNRRHLPSLIRAMPTVLGRVPAARLVIVGANRTHPRQDLQTLVRELGLGPHVTLTSFAADDELRLLYQQAAAFAFLSEYEGFGLTPLEALASGVPTIVLDTPVAREVYGDAVRYVPKPEPATVAGALVDLLTSRAARQALLVRIPPVLARYSWQRAAAGTLQAIEDAAASR